MQTPRPGAVHDTCGHRPQGTWRTVYVRESRPVAELARALGAIDGRRTRHRVIVPVSLRCDGCTLYRPLPGA